MTRLARRARWAAAVVVAALCLVLAARPAFGQEPPEPPPVAATTAPPADSPCALGKAGAESSSIVPDDCWGRFPSSHYDIGCDEGAWNHISRKVYCTFTDLAFQGARSSTALALWLVQWSYGFDIYDRLGGQAIAIADTFDRHLIGPLALSQFMWFCAIAWAAATALRGRLTMAAGELVVSFVIAILAGVFMANPGGYLQGMFDTMGSVSGALFATASGQPPPEDGLDAAAVLAPLQAEIHSAFIEQPYDFLNWGGVPTGQCAAARDAILADGPHGNDDAPRDAMNAAGCDAQADFNHDPNGTRLFGAVLTFAAALIMVVLISLVAVTVVVAQMVGIVLFSLFPFALLAGILPAGGRTLAWAWLGALGRVILAVVGMSFVLSLLLLTLQALLASTADVALIERFALINIVIVTMFIARKRILAGGHSLASQVAQRLATRRVGGERSAAWMAAPAVAGVTGFALGAGVGNERPTRTGRFAGTAARNQMANRRLHKHAKAAERRANRTTTRQRTEITVDAEGNPEWRTALSVDGPAPKSRRARATRDRLEHKASARHVRAEARYLKGSPSSTGDRDTTSATAGGRRPDAAATEPATATPLRGVAVADKADAQPGGGSARERPNRGRPTTDPRLRRRDTGWLGGSPGAEPDPGPVDPEE
jgi:hypothetical protein